MIRNYKIADLQCLCSSVIRKDKIVYILYPMDFLSGWIESAAERYGVTIVVITGMDWQNVFSPWKAPGVPKGDPDFKGESPEFLKLLQNEVIPGIENSMNLGSPIDRTLIGVSMSGLFALWQWMVCDTFTNIASLSGSFWYEGFVEWIKSQPIPHKNGKAFFLLGDQESKSKIKAFSSVVIDTNEIITILNKAGINTMFRCVPGNHYSDPIPRLNLAMISLFGSGELQK